MVRRVSFYGIDLMATRVSYQEGKHHAQGKDVVILGEGLTGHLDGWLGWAERLDCKNKPARGTQGLFVGDMERPRGEGGGPSSGAGGALFM